MNVIVDIQGFKNEENDFIPKEIAIQCGKSIFSILIKPPCPFYALTKKERLQVAWIERHRGILWNEGYVPYLNYKFLIQNILKNKCIFTKGYEKVLWLKKIVKSDNVHNLENKNCPSLTKLYENYSSSSDILSCIYHNKICALRNVFYLNKWCLENKIFL